VKSEKVFYAIFMLMRTKLSTELKSIGRTSCTFMRLGMPGHQEPVRGLQ
jgi:hypothetical protein